MKIKIKVLIRSFKPDKQVQIDIFSENIKEISYSSASKEMELQTTNGNYVITG